jgi:hypothetical protein
MRPQEGVSRNFRDRGEVLLDGRLFEFLAEVFDVRADMNRLDVRQRQAAAVAPGEEQSASALVRGVTGT